MPPSIDDQKSMLKKRSPIEFTINGRPHAVPSSTSPDTRLVDYIRYDMNLTGTKAMCYEGGCGICTLVATTQDLETNTEKTFAFRSCQTLLYSCAGWKIETIESLGNKRDGYHPLQQAISGFYGTQCGYCTPGFIMNMYGEQSRVANLSMQEIEMLFDGNLCRCTGYRPILDAFKSTRADAPSEIRKKLIDIEEAYKSRCPKTGKNCNGKCPPKTELSCSSIQPNGEMEFSIDAIQWFRPNSISSVYKVLKHVPASHKIRLVVGNTGQGVFKFDGPYNTYIDTTAVPDLSVVAIGTPLKIGANVSLNRCIRIFREMATTYTAYRHLEQIAKHWEFVANNGIRNTGCWSGNLMMKHQHIEFPSDIFLTLTVIDAVLQIGNSADSSIADVSMADFTSRDMTRSLIISMTIPPQENVFVRTYKITQRAVNSHAYVNAAIKFEADTTDQYRLTKKPHILFGGIRPDFVHASATESFLTGKRLGLNAVVKEAMNQLAAELKPDVHPLDGSPEFRTNLAQSLLYKAILALLETNADLEYRSGGPILVRPASSATQSFDPNEDTWPIGQAIPKLESDYQTSGEAEYVNDTPSVSTELHGAFVQTTVGKANIASIDATEALGVDGVVDFITTKDIPGRNSFISSSSLFSAPGGLQILQRADPLFVDAYIDYAGQSVGLIVAKTREAALDAARKVKITYKNQQKPILTIKEAMKKPETNIDTTFNEINVNNIHVNTDEEGPLKQMTTIKGELNVDTQYHMPMETFICLAVPIEDGLDVYLSTQWVTESQNAIAEVLGVDVNSLNLFTRRIGGSYGSKIYRSNVVCCAAALAANKLQVPVRISLPLDVNLSLTAGREPYLTTYSVSFDGTGKFSSVVADVIGNEGHVANEASVAVAAYKFSSVYYSPSWRIVPKMVNTDRGSSSWTRAPGSVNATMSIENIIEHVADYLNKDPLDVREANFLAPGQNNAGGIGPQGPNLAATSIVPQLKEQAMYKTRRNEIEQFNQANRWKKRGISLMTTFYPLHYPPFKYSSHVSIYAKDGTVAISHGGIEMGQGINTKVAQATAKYLNIPIELIKIKPTNTFDSANSSVTGGSFGTDLVTQATIKCCEKLKARMDVVAKEMREKDKIEPTWEKLVKECFRKNVDLSERHWLGTNEHPKGYDIFAGICIEVELDVLTGQWLILRADIIEDCGRSLSPYIDIGQIEGSVIMGIGLCTSEIIKLDEATGKVLTTGTWDYKIPSALDIPIEFNVTLLPNGDNQNGVVRSKATGEPAVCLGYGIVGALRHAIKSARIDAGTTGWFEMDTPLTIERIQQLCLNSPEQFNVTKNEMEEPEPFETLIIPEPAPPVDQNCTVN